MKGELRAERMFFSLLRTMAPDNGTVFTANTSPVVKLVATETVAQEPRPISWPRRHVLISIDELVYREGNAMLVSFRSLFPYVSSISILVKPRRRKNVEMRLLYPIQVAFGLVVKFRRRSRRYIQRECYGLDPVYGLPGETLLKRKRVAAACGCYGVGPQEVHAACFTRPLS